MVVDIDGGGGGGGMDPDPIAPPPLFLSLSLSFFLSFPHGLALAWDLHTSIYLPTYYC